jgi:hypothetical protein
MAGPPHETRCSAVSAGLGEPLVGTAFTDSRLLCVEHLGPWPHSVDRHPDPGLAALVARARTAGARCSSAAPGGGPDRTPGAPCCSPTPSPAGCASVRCGFAVPGSSPTSRSTTPAPVLPSTRRCCSSARTARGTSAARSRAARSPRPSWPRSPRTGPAGLWECSHLGGHRFAPTALVLPTGYLCGRLDVATAVAARKGAGQGEVETAHCHGRIAWKPAGQVAELRIREAEGLRDADGARVASGG